jgi:Cdc6-like AAA superfamily ATPase
MAAKSPQKTASKQQPPEQPIDREMLATRVFTPAMPVSESDLFAGRLNELRRVVDTITQRGRHAIIFGERGVGKTSLASVISSRLRMPETTVIAPRVNCDSNDSYITLWRKVFSQIDLLRKIPAAGFQLTIFQETVKAADVVSENAGPDEVRRLLSLLAETGLIIIIFDEFDRIMDQTTRRMMADTIKALSDHDVDVTVVIVGVADTVDELISQHESIERAIKQTKMPPMSVPELKQIIDNGMKRLQMDVDDEAKSEIALLCQGFPHYAHSLGLHATRACLDRDSLRITSEDVDAAIRRALSDVDQTIRSVYDKAIFSPQKDTLHADVLLACALVKTGEFGYFTAGSVREPLSAITGKRYDIPGFSRHLKDFSEEARGRILQKEGETRKFRFRFRNPLMRPLIIMKGVADGEIDRDFLKRYHA